jgi:hypothetical protein
MKFKVIDNSTGEKYKLGQGEMLVMTTGGVILKVGGIGDYYLGMRKLSESCPSYKVLVATHKENDEWVYNET